MQSHRRDETHPQWHESSWPLTNSDMAALGERGHYCFPHIRPNSVLVASVGNMWLPGAHYRVQDMVVHATDKGLPVAFEEIRDHGVLPYSGVASMRSGAIQMAMDSGVEWLFLIENDVLLEPDTLERLIAVDRPIVAPLLVSPRGTVSRLSMPHREPNTGVQLVRWMATSAILFKVKVFNATGPMVFSVCDTELQIFQRFDHFGHQACIDTDTIVNLASAPGFRSSNMSYEELKDEERSRYERRRHNARDRNPPPDWDPVFATNGAAVTPNGAYLPMGSLFRRNVSDEKSPGEAELDGV